jgi:hypothetical protein
MGFLPVVESQVACECSIIEGIIKVLTWTVMGHLLLVPWISWELVFPTLALPIETSQLSYR